LKYPKLKKTVVQTIDWALGYFCLLMQHSRWWKVNAQLSKVNCLCMPIILGFPRREHSSA